MDLSFDGQGANCHPIFGKRSGLIDAEYRCGPQRLDHRDMPRENIDLGQPPSPQSEEDRQHDWKLFRQHCHGQGDPRQEPLQPIASRHSVDDDNDNA